MNMQWNRWSKSCKSTQLMCCSEQDDICHPILLAHPKGCTLLSGIFNLGKYMEDEHGKMPGVSSVLSQLLIFNNSPYISVEVCTLKDTEIVFVRLDFRCKRGKIPVMEDFSSPLIFFLAPNDQPLTNRAKCRSKYRIIFINYSWNLGGKFMLIFTAIIFSRLGRSPELFVCHAPNLPQSRKCP